jgi:hypothetical protein
MLDADNVVYLTTDEGVELVNQAVFTEITSSRLN